jgi:RimJ/RimL family protein N-acetyltransferase
LSTLHNEYGQPIAAPVPDWHGAKAPEAVTLTGRFVRLEPVDVERHARDLFDAYATETDGSNWTYLAVGPFDSFDVWKAHFTKMAESKDPRHFAVIDLATGKAVGTLSLMRIDAPNGVIEVGHVTYSPLLQRSRASTETIYVLMKYVFDTLGNRRFEWKCNSLNAPSRAAAERYGFTYEGLFRQAIVTRGRNRDTTWYSILDNEWPATRVGFEQWLDDRNFDADGRQIARLTDLIAVQRAAAANRTTG